jgi:hypothetical protein
MLPFVDEHDVLVSAAAEAIWPLLGTAMRSTPPIAGRVAAAVLGTDPRRESGDPLTPGGALPGFRVREAVPGRRLVLAGRHHFSDYTLTFTLTQRPDGTLLAARTDAAFPGLPGRAYRALVIGSGGHRVAVRRMLGGIRRAAEGR